MENKQNFKPVNDMIPRDWLLAQLESMEQSRLTLLAGSAGKDTSIGISYDAGYLACLVFLRSLIVHPEMTADELDTAKLNDLEAEDDDE